MKVRKILIVVLCSALAVCCTVSFAGCNNSKESEESSKASLTSQNSEETEESTESSKADENSKDEESGKQESSTSSDEFTEEELQAMSEVDDSVKKLMDSSEYKNAAVSEKKRMAKNLINDLADKGLIIKGSIYVQDTMISFTYKGGALGGVQLESFESDMNDPAGSSNPESSQQSGTSTEESNTHNIYEEPLLSDFEISDEEKALINKKTFSDFEKTAVKSKGNAKGLIKKYFTDKLSHSNTHCEMYAFSMFTGYTEETELIGKSFIEYQESDSKIYMRTVSDFGVSEYYNQDQGIIIKDGKRYVLDNINTSYYVSEQDTDYGAGMSGIGKAMGTVEESGTCKLDGKNLYYELAVDSNGSKTVAYFENDKFYKLEVYQSNSSGTSTDSQGELLLQGYLFAAFDLNIDNSLYNIPSGYIKQG